jgi:hypothetical protein
MLPRRRRIAATTVLLAAFALLPASSAPATTIGSNLLSVPNGGACPLSEAGETSCSFVQESLADGHAAPGGVRNSTAGVITGYRVSTGLATPATASARVRIRTLDAGGVSYVYDPTPYEELPLDQPGVHAFPTRLPIDRESAYLVIDTAVTGRGGGEAAAPFAHRASRAGNVWKWVPALSERLVPQSESEGDLELLLNATIEPDRDRDGYGDRTQDACPEDPKRQADCDRRPPRTKLTYRIRQGFLRTGKVVVRLRSSEAGRVLAHGQIDIDAGPNVVWGINPARKPVRKGGRATLVLRVPPRAREAAARSFAHGRHVVARVFVYATDAAGNESGTSVATIRPKR